MKAGRSNLSFEKFGSSLAFDSVNSRALVGMASLMQVILTAEPKSEGTKFRCELINSLN